MTKKEFEAKLEESKHLTCGAMDRESYYDCLIKLYDKYYSTTQSSNYHLALQLRHS